MEFGDMTLLAAARGATSCVASTSWVGPVLQFLGTIGAVGVGAYLISRREQKAHERKESADKLFLAVTVSAVLEAFTSDCADVADDDGTSEGRRTPEGELRPQVETPDLNYASLGVVRMALPAFLLDQVHALPRKIDSARRYLGFIASFDEDDYFFERQLKYAELGVVAAQVSERLRLHVGLPPLIDPDSTTRQWIEKRLDALREIEQRRKAAQVEWAATFASKMQANEQPPPD